MGRQLCRLPQVLMRFIRFLTMSGLTSQKESLRAVAFAAELERSEILVLRASGTSGEERRHSSSAKRSFIVIFRSLARSERCSRSAAGRSNPPYFRHQPNVIRASSSRSVLLRMDRWISENDPPTQRRPPGAVRKLSQHRASLHSRRRCRTSVIREAVSSYCWLSLERP